MRIRPRAGPLGQIPQIMRMSWLARKETARQAVELPEGCGTVRGPEVRGEPAGSPQRTLPHRRAVDGSEDSAGRRAALSPFTQENQISTIVANADSMWRPLLPNGT